MKQYSHKFLCVACLAILIFALTACNQSTTNPNQAFLDANNNGPSSVPTTPTTAPTQPTDTTQPTIQPSTEPTEPTKKPDGFTWNDWSDTSEPTTPSTPNNNNNDKPTQPTTPQSQKPTNNGMSQLLQTALNSLGKTTQNGSNFTAYLPQKDSSGGIYIVHIKSTSSSATKTTYVFYESKSDYNNAKSAAPHKTFNDELRLITMSTEEVFPITNPETSSYVLFSGYRLWR